MRASSATPFFAAPSHEKRLLPKILAAVVFALGVSLGPMGASADTLEEALVKAYATNPTLQAQRAELRGTDELISQALSGWRPTVTFTGDAGKTKAEDELGFFQSDETRTPLTAALSVEQPIYRGGRTMASTEQAEFLVLANRAALISVEQQVFLDAATAYLDVLRDYAVLELATNNVRVLKSQLEAARDRFEVGEVTRTDVAQAEARVSEAVSQQIEAQGLLISSRAAYLRVVGEMPSQLVWPSSLTTLAGTEDEAKQIAKSGHPDLVEAAFTERAAVAEVRVVTGELLPEVSLTADLSRAEANSSRDSLSRSASIAAELTIPLYQSGAVYSRVREAKERAAQRRIEVEETHRSVMEVVTQAWESLITARAKITAFSAEVRASSVALEGVEEEAFVGLRTTLDVLDAEQELFEAQVKLVRAQHDEIVSGYWLLQSTGGLTAEGLELPVPAYDVDAHYRDVRDKWFGLGDN